MATQSDYDAVRNALLVTVTSDIESGVPGWARGMIPGDLAPKLADALARKAVDTLDAHRGIVDAQDAKGHIG